MNKVCLIKSISVAAMLLLLNHFVAGQAIENNSNKSQEKIIEARQNNIQDSESSQIQKAKAKPKSYEKVLLNKKADAAGENRKKNNSSTEKNVSHNYEVIRYDDEKSSKQIKSNQSRKSNEKSSHKPKSKLSKQALSPSK